MPYGKGDIAFLRCLKSGLEWAKENPHGQIKLDWCTTIPASELPAYVLGRIHHAISARGNDHWSRGRRNHPDYQAKLRRDQRAIRDFRLHRIVRSGSGLETWEGRRAAPDVHERFRAWRD